MITKSFSWNLIQNKTSPSRKKDGVQNYFQVYQWKSQQGVFTSEFKADYFFKLRILNPP
jgi:hypothetical protein